MCVGAERPQERSMEATAQVFIGPCYWWHHGRLAQAAGPNARQLGTGTFATAGTHRQNGSHLPVTAIAAAPRGLGRHRARGQKPRRRLFGRWGEVAGLLQVAPVCMVGDGSIGSPGDLHVPSQLGCATAWSLGQKSRDTFSRRRSLHMWRGYLQRSVHSARGSKSGCKACRMIGRSRVWPGRISWATTPTRQPVVIRRYDVDRSAPGQRPSRHKLRISSKCKRTTSHLV